MSLERCFLKGIAMIEFDRRKMERFDLELPAKLTWTKTDNEHESIELMTNNICSDSAFFKTNNPFAVGTAVKLDVILPLNNFKNVKYKKSHIHLSGSVIRTDHQGMAIRLSKKYKMIPF
jgi:hypothetical protein